MTNIIEKNIKSLSDSLKEYYPNIQLNENGFADVYGNVAEEYDALRHGVALRNTTGNLLIKMFGKEVLSFLNRISTNKLDDLEVHALKHTLFLNEKGKIIDFAAVLNLDNLAIVRAGFAPRKRLFRWIERYSTLEDIIIENVSNNYFQFEIIGPQSKSFMSVVGGSQFDSLEKGKIAYVIWEENTFFAANISNANINRYLVFGSLISAVPILDLIIESSKLFDFSLAGELAYEKLRIESGVPEYPQEINDFISPFALKLENEICWDKGRFIGCEALKEMRKEISSTKTLIGVSFENAITTNFDKKIYDGKENPIGEITSLTKSMILRKYVGLAFIESKYADDEHNLKLNIGGEQIKIKKTELPFVK
ncbi:MAG: aminomethyl transferase family protein [Chlorobi bacterium]|nr:aminomethyl transferase family protein [Chlorobiota bacterium]